MCPSRPNNSFTRLSDAKQYILQVGKTAVFAAEISGSFKKARPSKQNLRLITELHRSNKLFIVPRQFAGAFDGSHNDDDALF